MIGVTQCSKIAAPVAPHKPTSHLQSSSLPPTDYAVHPKIGWNPVDPANIGDIKVDSGAMTLPAYIRNDEYDNRPGSTLRAQLAAAIDEQASAFQQCKRRLIDVENEGSNPRKRGSRARNHRADREERVRVDPPSDAKELEECVCRHGRKFVILCGLWLALGTGDCEAFFKTPLDDKYDAELRFGADGPDGDEHKRGRPTLPHRSLSPARCYHAYKVDDQEVNTFHLSTSQSPVLHFASGNLDFNEVFCHPFLFKTNGSKFGGGVQAEDESVWEELAAATTALVDMPVVSDDDGNDDV
ncbi:hypothetical protein DFH08DRAFT_825368 [Mycena albidolilacea]|uniref:Uncharacterized protein n=1 Tax=Mycena albidolilacea TaxID=1033008 RepID=A0AAD6Z202_9AGAR|nr:hypothetical protein DFH08DRAFT_825368 [Mycena albidolilacea]